MHRLNDIQPWLRDLAGAAWAWGRGRARRQDYFLLGAPTDACAAAPTPAGVRLDWVLSPDDPLIAPALAINAEQNLGEHWCVGQLLEGAQCLLVLAEDVRPVAVAWWTRRDFWIDEIGHTIHPGPDGCYLYADWVTPDYRGRGLQRLLIATRMAQARQQGARRGWSVVRPDNLPSLRSYRACGFVPAQRIARVHARQMSFTAVRRLPGALDGLLLSHGGWPAGGRVFATRV